MAHSYSATAKGAARKITDHPPISAIPPNRFIAAPVRAISFPANTRSPCSTPHAQGAKFAEKDVPADITEKRAKVQQRVEKKKEEAEKPHKVNTSALKKKIHTQLEGINLLESLVNDLMRAGLGTLNAKSARQVEEQAKQLGNAYLPGAQNALHALTGLFYRSQISSEDELKTSERNAFTAPPWIS
ncbi:MAG: hypothetical protein WDN00_17685 [Limisphaerales bacterium]